MPDRTLLSGSSQPCDETLACVAVVSITFKHERRTRALGTFLLLFAQCPRPSFVLKGNRNDCHAGLWNLWLSPLCVFQHGVTSLTGSWVPAISRSFHYWQPAPMAGKSWQTSHEPQALKGRQAPVTLIKQWKRQRGEGRGKIEKLPGAKNRYANAG